MAYLGLRQEWTWTSYGKCHYPPWVLEATVPFEDVRHNRVLVLQRRMMMMKSMTMVTTTALAGTVALVLVVGNDVAPSVAFRRGRGFVEGEYHK
jgi:hypothetical protein